MTPPAPPLTLRQTYATWDTPRLLDHLTAAAREVVALRPTGRAPEVKAAAAVLQRRCGGRTSAVGTRDTEQPGEALAELVDAAGGFFTITSDVLRHDHLGPVTLADRKDWEQDPQHAVHVRSHTEVLTDYGLAPFPGMLAGTAPLILVYEVAPLLGRLLTAITAGADTSALQEEILHGAPAPA
ncbi:hypothetical protein AB0N09_21750 [Streptomyces erythrochromogenes]|uniref:hypothetical protein n=1 Tax=Streptomyces erythrochromogenes TaxID=285574 RepID=UPI003440BA19